MKNPAFTPTGKQHEWAGEIVQCNACDKKFPITSIRMHIYHMARTEAWLIFLGKKREAHHGEIYKKSTIETNAPQRAWRV